ncbi:MAG TPA: hypothetical protein VIJ94_04245 [Caulobacteraceae bacterium]
MATWIEVETPSGEREAINADLVQRVRVFDGVTRLVFRAMPGGFDEIQVKGLPRQVQLRLAIGADWPREDDKVISGAPRERGRTKAGAVPPKSPQTRSKAVRKA